MDWKIALAFAAITALAVVVKMAGQNLKAGKPREKPKKRPLLTDREQAMYWKLVETFPMPDFQVLTQVSMGALLSAKTTAVRNTFDRKIVDFVVTSKALEVLCVIELDDRTHTDKREKDRDRDAMLKAAGYKAIRFANAPNSEQLRTAVLGKTAPTGIDTPKE